MYRERSKKLLTLDSRKVSGLAQPLKEGGSGFALEAINGILRRHWTRAIALNRRLTVIGIGHNFGQKK